MKKLLIVLALVLAMPAIAQEKQKKNLFKELYSDFLKYGTFYAAGNIENARLVQPNYFIRTNPDDFYGIPQV